jgi:hypothetical protein
MTSMACIILEKGSEQGQSAYQCMLKQNYAKFEEPDRVISCAIALSTCHSMVSSFAIGVKLYHSARLGEEVPRSARPIVVSEFSVWRDEPTAQDVRFRVRCSKGTYVRSLAHDLVRLGCPASVTRAIGFCAITTNDCSSRSHA